MCGIIGNWKFNGEHIDLNEFKIMKEKLIHRGPDESGVFIENNLALGHQRLSIIDLDTGKQPISNKTGKIWITYNGEVYNFGELRSILKKKGYEFRTNTDTEVVVNLYEEYGNEFVNMLSGMFAFAIWDSRKKIMILARDRMGQKPLYYYYDENQLIFASELKAIIKKKNIKKEVDPNGLSDYLYLGYIPSPLTIYNNIKKLAPGNIAVITETEFKINRYWKPIVGNEIELDSKSNLSDFNEDLLNRLKKAVKIRLMSDVPLGVLLSGGIDSSAIVALMSMVSTDQINTFTICSNDPEFDESEYARLIAKRFGTKHHELTVEMDALNILPEVINSFDEPFSDPSSIPTYCVSKFAREKVKVVLSGDGGDELFAGYPWYELYSQQQYFQETPNKYISKLYAQIYNNWPARWRGKGRFELLRRPSLASRYSSTKNHFPYYLRENYFSKELLNMLDGASECRTVEIAGIEAQTEDVISMMQYADLMTYLPEDLLVKIDRMSMLHSLEVRSPLIDHELVEFILQIPSRMKLYNGESKYILKKVLEPWLPKKILHKPKSGFGIPLKNWLKNELFETANDILLGSTAKNRGYLNSEGISKLLEYHRSGKSDPTVTTKQIWNLLCLEMWFQQNTFN